jgi:YD repeat-containing protein
VFAGDKEVCVSTSIGGTHAQNWTFDHETLGRRRTPSSQRIQLRSSLRRVGPSSRPRRRRGSTSYDYDARSVNTSEHLPSTLNPNKYGSDASGALKQYTDPTGKPTKITNDGSGRPVILEHAMGRSKIHYAAARVDFTRDRQKREQHYIRNGGLLSEVRNATGSCSITSTTRTAAWSVGGNVV